MFLGHFAAGLAAKKAAPAVSLGLLVTASQFIDLLWPVLLLVGAEEVAIVPGLVESNALSFTHYPWSHSLAMVMLWAAVFAAVYGLIRKDLRGAIVLGACVISHWLLDLVVHIPDLPLYPGHSAHYGMGLWHSVTGTLFVEFGLLAAGIVLYLRSTYAVNRKGTVVFWILIALLVLVQLMNAFGPPPPDVNSIAWAGNLQWLFVALAFWADKHRRPKNTTVGFSGGMAISPPVL